MTRIAAWLMLAWLGFAFLQSDQAVAQSPQGAEKFLANQFLVANESMADPRFAKTVIYLCRHDREGAFGLIINRPLGKMPVGKLLEPLGIGKDEAGGSEEEIAMRLGGPVNFRKGFILHSDDYESKANICKHGPVTVTADGEVLRATSNGKGPRQTVIFFGYAGWGPGQLEGELAQDAWSTAPAEIDMMFTDNPEGIWEKAIKNSGVDL